jgi:alkylation response protein AidB-like acyl-CoA dehydrogenase
MERGLPWAAVLADELGALDVGLSLGVSLHCEAFLGTLGRLGRTDAQHDLYDRALRGGAIGCMAITEHHGGSDVGAIRTAAHRTARGWHLSGRKRYSSNAETATHVLVLARSEEKPCLFVVPLDAEGVVRTGSYLKAGNDSCDATGLDFEVDLGEDALLGGVGSGLLVVLRNLSQERVAIAAAALAAAYHALGLAVAFSRVRAPFGRRLIEHQAVAHRLADLSVELTTCDATLDAALRDAARGRLDPALAAALKLAATGTACRVADACVQVLGGRGYTASFPVERIWRDLRLARIGGGADEVLREMLAERLDAPREPFDRLVDDYERRDSALRAAAVAPADYDRIGLTSDEDQAENDDRRDSGSDSGRRDRDRAGHDHLAATG